MAWNDVTERLELRDVRNGRVMESWDVGSENFFHTYFNRSKREIRMIREKADKVICSILSFDGLRARQVKKDYEMSGFDELGRKIMRDSQNILILDDA